ncbi:MAG: AMP-binding protein, partial [Planctomycetota bacterium]
MAFNDWLNRRTLYTPDRVAVVDDSTGAAYTYGQLDRQANVVASYLQHQLGLAAGDRVACLSGNRLEYLSLYFACGKLGVVLTPLNYRLPPAAAVELIADCRPALLVYESQFAKVAKANLPCPAMRLDRCESNEQTSIAAIASGDGAELPPPAIHASAETDVAMILYTSGATGRPKGAMISWRQIHFNALNTIIGLGLTQEDVAFLNMPLYHTGGWHVLFTPLMLLGGRVVLQTRFDPVRCNDRTGPEGVTILFAIPTMMRMMWEADNFQQADLSRVR